MRGDRMTAWENRPFNNRRSKDGQFERSEELVGAGLFFARLKGESESQTPTFGFLFTKCFVARFVGGDSPDFGDASLLIGIDIFQVTCGCADDH